MEKKSYQVPREDGGVLVDPPLGELASLVAANREVLADSGGAVAGTDSRKLRADARRSVLEAARKYMREHGLTVPSVPEGPIVLTGHQPAFYHPGIWFKNFLAGWLAKQVKGVALNIVVDNDEARKPGLEVPVEGEGVCTKVPVALGPELLEVPYEEWTLPEPDAAERLVAEARSLIERDDMRSAFNDFGRELLDAAGSWADMATFMTVARRRYEDGFGLANLEVPLSRMCELPEFARFFGHVVAELPRFRECYNGALALYRKLHGIRNAANPLPDLSVEGDCFEAPFWVWREGQARRPLTVAVRDGVRALLDGGEEVAALNADGLSDGERMAARLSELREQGYKVRTRALTTTLFARMFLSDVFIHGTGGGNYDQITDEIIRTFMGVEPPGYVVASATVCLPLSCKVVPDDEVTRLLYLIRDLHYNPDRHLPANLEDDPKVKDLVKRKWGLIGRRGKTSLERREIFATIRRINAELEEMLGDAPEQARADLAQARADRASAAVLGGRDYAFCLYPREQLASFYGRVLP